ncbi:UbiX family flavin prenyltransferase [Clostridium scatologenes]|uniref:Flavin prenyltransferase UbiX n=1 Tax=Clostridium scatologenes TaxID=1548 RepID=A0A0E3JZK5_CLOSL|nr:UbiX family flavin prenyltransferase [Clostridium scatologenes]AKA68395.1 3-octaprenyl-4-hydroxybenzoate carboxy-lyase [Clostridium scatologenes]
MECNLTINNKKRLVIGMSGASGAILGIEILKTLKKYPDWESHLVISKSAEQTILEETNYKLIDVINLADKTYSLKDIGASIASGTFRTEGMVIVPCSMKTAAGIACGYSDNLLLRAADVTIKERRKLVLVPRESPLSTIHLRNLLSLSELGTIIVPPMMSYYNKPASVEDLNTHIIGKILDKFHIEVNGFNRWGENASY